MVIIDPIIRITLSNCFEEPLFIHNYNEWINIVIVIAISNLIVTNYIASIIIIITFVLNSLIQFDY